MKRNQALIIIDMQPIFPAAKEDGTVNAVVREIRRARRFGHYILLVEFVGSGQTHPRIMKSLEGYRRKTYLVKKRDSDGSSEIVKCIIENGLSISKLKICGVNTDVCVADTVDGLVGHNLRLRIPIEIIADACNSDNLYSISISMRDALPRKKNIRVRGKLRSKIYAQ